MTKSLNDTKNTKENKFNLTQLKIDINHSIFDFVRSMGVSLVLASFCVLRLSAKYKTSVSLQHLQDEKCFLMKLCSFCRDRCCSIDRASTVVAPCGHTLRHRLARNSLGRRHKLVSAEARK